MDLLFLIRRLLTKTVMWLDETDKNCYLKNVNPAKSEDLE